MENGNIIREKIAIREIYKSFTAIGEGVDRLTRDREQELAALRDAGDPDATMIMARSLVNLIVHRQQKRYKHYDSNILGDALSDALIRTVRAAELYDPTNGVQFSSYASRFIDGALADAARKHVEDVHVGSTARYDAIKLEKFRYNFEFRNGRMPSDAEIEDALGFAPSRVGRLEEVSQVHLDNSVPEEGQAEAFEGTTAPVAFDTLAEQQDAARIESAKSRMTDKQRVAFVLIYEAEWTFRQVADALDINVNAIQSRMDGARAKVEQELLGE